MDDSWRVGMGTPAAPSSGTARHVPSYTPRRSTEDTTTSHRRRNTISDDPLNPEDYHDVFGGPPRTILSRQFSAAFRISPPSSAGFSCAEIFRPPVGRILPEFRIPGRQGSDFYSDIFGCEDHERVARSRSRSKASSSSMLSSEELSPLRPAVYDDGSHFGSKLRELNVESKLSSRRMAFQESHGENLKSYSFGLRRRDVSPETISLEPMSNGSFPVSSPSSPVSSVCQSSSQDQKTENEEEEEDEDMDSYVIEINSDNKEGTCEPNGVEEAIAWAKEKFQMKTPIDEVSNVYGVSDHGSSEQRRDKCDGEEETGQFFEYAVQTEMRIIDAKISLWSTGKESNIRLLLSSLHQIMWPDCGWLAVSATDLTRVSQVKKAYQKARLCLHPDKVQQRGATVPQKHIAKKAFCVLQDAWAAFVAQEVL